MGCAGSGSLLSLVYWQWKHFLLPLKPSFMIEPSHSSVLHYFRCVNQKLYNPSLIYFTVTTAGNDHLLRFMSHDTLTLFVSCIYYYHCLVRKYMRLIRFNWIPFPPPPPSPCFIFTTSWRLFGFTSVDMKIFLTVFSRGRSRLIAVMVYIGNIHLYWLCTACGSVFAVPNKAPPSSLILSFYSMFQKMVGKK